MQASLSAVWPPVWQLPAMSLPSPSSQALQVDGATAVPERHPCWVPLGWMESHDKKISDPGGFTLGALSPLATFIVFQECSSALMIDRL